jgi:hypothetical protein
LKKWIRVSINKKGEVIMSTEAKSETSQNIQKERYCSKCDTKVDHDSEGCPSCKEALYGPGRPSWQAGLLGYCWGGLMGAITLTIVKVIEYFGGFNNKMLEMAVFGITAVGSWKSKKAQLMGRRDLAVWKLNTLSKSILFQNDGAITNIVQDEGKAK